MLRRRTGKDDTSSSDGNKQNSKSQTEEDRLRAEFDGAKVKQLVIQPQRRSKRRNGLIFALGGLFGIFIAVFFANQQEVISLESLLDLNLDTLIDVIPQGIMRDAKEFSVLYSHTLWLAVYHPVKPANQSSYYSNTSATPSIMIRSQLV